MNANVTTRRTALALPGVVAVMILLLWMAGPAVSAPRSGITAARGVPAEAVAQPVTTGQSYTAASIRAPAGQSDTYFVTAPLAAWIAGALGALLLLAGAQRWAIAQRRGRGGRLADLTGRRPPSTGHRRDRRAA